MPDEKTRLDALLEGIENAISSPDYSHPVFDIGEEYEITKRFTDSSLFFFRHRFGLGKSTFGLCSLTEGDMFLSETQKQSKENQEEFKEYHPDRDTIRILGFNFMFGNISDEKKEHVPEHIRELWEKEKSVVQGISKYAKRHETPSEAILEWREDNPDKNPDILEEWSKQFREDVWKDNVIFACSNRIELLNRRAFLSTMDRVMVDEGVENTFVEHDFLPLQDELVRLGARGLRTQVPDPSEQEILELLKGKNSTETEIGPAETTQQFVKFDSYEPEIDNLDKEFFDKLQALTRKILIHAYAHAAGLEETGLTGDLKNIAGKTDEIYPEPLMTEFSMLYIYLAKKNSYKGIPRLRMERHALKEEGELQKLKQLNRMISVMEKVWQSRFNRLSYNKEEKLELKLEKPIYYELWDFIDRADCEVWILDATTGKKYYNHLFKKYRYYRSLEDGRFGDLDIAPVYLGEGNSRSSREEKIKVNFQRRSYDSLNQDHPALDCIEYKWYIWDWNVKSEERDTKATVGKRQGERSALMKALSLQIEEEAEDQDVAVISYQDTAKFFEKAEFFHFAIATGMNQVKDFDKLYVIGHPPIPNSTGILNEYIKQYREEPKHHPLHEENDRMREFSSYGGLVGFSDIVEVVPNEVGVPSEIVRGETMWADWFNRNVEQGVFDALFRIRPQKVDSAEVVRIGFNPEDFFTGEPDGVASELVDLPDRVVIENWSSMPKKFYLDKEYVTSRGKLKKGLKVWKELRNDYSREEIREMSQEEIANETSVSQQTVSRYRKGWRKLKLLK